MSENSVVNYSINLPNKLNIKTIFDVRSIILDKLAIGKSLTIHVPEDSEVDLSFVQLIESARIRAKSSGVILSLAQVANAQMRSVLDRGGFTAGFSEEDEKFWFHGKAQQ
ncbi:hypothetical protein QO002_003615 [Pararhizobium capsulatum DSM 1112]|uniref:STAS domain-containing protein n=1 Tax=Pararhizobium capsulatum DSM 1112 TaxID=1121113 RepID=A0ABU0BT83_9HYPH|nr:hypothetical protein [Pararhizobium capsulatum]MDQ0321477.1 hypothetical protein [Pararhizobium capsulatum DSM 1112]